MASSLVQALRQLLRASAEAAFLPATTIVEASDVIARALLGHAPARQVSRREYAATFEKIAAAQRHLADAVTALDTLKVQFAGERQRLEELGVEIAQRREELQAAQQEHETARRLLAEDRKALARLLGLGRERRIGFITGILASLIAAGVWQGAVYLLARYT